MVICHAKSSLVDILFILFTVHTKYFIRSDQISSSVVSDSLGPHESQHARMSLHLGPSLSPFPASPLPQLTSPFSSKASSHFHSPSFTQATPRFTNCWSLAWRILTITLLVCRVFSCVVGRGCLLWPVRSLGKTLLAFDLLRFVLQGQICLLL